MSCGLVGLPNAGKSTLFNALTRAGAAVAAYPFTTIDPNVGIAPVPDPRLERIAAIVKPERVVPATVQFVDVAGLVRGSSKGEGLGNQFLGHLRDTHAVVMVIRCFVDPDIAHIYGEVDPQRDIEILSLELMLADMATLERRIERTQTAAKSGEKRLLAELDLLRRLQAYLADGQPARTFAGEGDTSDFVGSLNLLSAKPALYVANVSEEELGAADAALAGRCAASPPVAAIQCIAAAEGAEVIAVSAKLESELNELSDDDAAAYLRELGVEEPGLARLVRASYRLLDLITFFTTTGGKEVRAWPVRRGTKAPQAAGEVHSDMERGFIRAEAVNYDDLMAAGSFAEARDRGLVRLEGREYAVQDGDIIHFRFGV
ncbi:MAG: redox-regulated ATPase YchF [Chloroflexi bacterium]|nr:redox-regulated ATPase YchF [Chloroflexota bacterium]